MADSILEAVTIDRAYFDTLLRRANHNNDDAPDAVRFANNSETVISVRRAEYESLLLQSRQFANLKRSLLGAGVTKENIDTLVQDVDVPIVPQADPYAVAPASPRQDYRSGLSVRPQQTRGPAAGYQAASFTGYSPTADNASEIISPFHDVPKHGTFEGNHEWSSHEHVGDAFSPSYSAEGPADAQVESFDRAKRPHYARMSRRTVFLCGLPPFATLGDVTSVVCGGQLLDVFLRKAEHIASVSFVQENDATSFYEYAKKNDIYIKNKRILVKWADRHFVLPIHVANKIATGATRNLIIRRCAAAHTEESVREDLEHIHNLVVINVEFIGGSCHVKTNSVHNAMYARTCMMSRAAYKGSKIEWDIDECDRPIEIIQRAPIKSPAQQRPSKVSMAGTRNRFDMLRLDDEDNNDSDDKFDTSSEMPGAVDVLA